MSDQRVIDAIRRRMLERGGGLIPITMSEAAKQIGTSQPGLTYILQGENGVSPSMALKLADWLGLSRATVLGWCGHEGMLGLLGAAEAAMGGSAAVERFARLVDGLPEAVAEAAVDAAAVVVRVWGLHNE